MIADRYRVLTGVQAMYSVNSSVYRLALRNSKGEGDQQKRMMDAMPHGAPAYRPSYSTRSHQSARDRTTVGKLVFFYERSCTGVLPAAGIQTSVTARGMP